ncbi:cyclase family protein [Acidaminobacter hydrogenoformans]|uniref:Kynurenine formamidase n=1 Tax=Acidaminobacter hydrogenoformans DSM 2784 TaxID=1120920 RepID=A0A1G5RUI8_9FIRM|nr:cyclase family protein [Acidaminobacter hydrogenoformans]SCZ77666.1 Kynurenine formamidase [Acidaminobacter hydrogenoformans DSM 2784]
MKLYDISMPIHEEMPVYKNDKGRRPKLTFHKKVAVDGVTSSTLELDLHTGTHLDAPLHMLPGGSAIDEVAMTSVLTACRVIALTELEGEISRSDLEPFEVQPGAFVLIKTRNSFSEAFDPGFVYLGLEAAKYLAELGVKGVGTDGLGIERGQEGHPTHKVLFEAGVMILEGLMLKNIEPGDYKLIALPLKIIGAEASPVRAVLVQEKKATE